MTSDLLKMAVCWSSVLWGWWRSCCHRNKCLGLEWRWAKVLFVTGLKDRGFPCSVNHCGITETIKAYNNNSKCGLRLYYSSLQRFTLFFCSTFKDVHVLTPLIRTGNAWILICPMDLNVWILHSFLVFEHCGSCKLARQATERHKSSSSGGSSLFTAVNMSSYF